MSKHIYALIGLLTTSNSFAQLNIDLDDFEIPPICENIQEFVTPVDLSPACLAAQTAATSFPPLLPAANQLCQVLEGTTATLGVFQIEINIIYEKCQLELAKIENELTKGISEYSDYLNTPFIKKKRLLGATSNQELEDKAVIKGVLDIDFEEWDEIHELSINDTSVFTKKRLIREVVKSNYVVDQFLVDGVANDLINMVVQMLHKSGSDVSIKASQDLHVRMTAELVYQQQAMQQIMNQYLALIAAEEQEKMASQKYFSEFIRGEQ